MKLAELKLKEIHPSDQNTRVDYNGSDMAELIKSITSVGLLNPIIVRQAGDMGYEIVAGHRRYHALKKLGTEQVSVQIVEATDEDASQIRLIENLHRKDLNAIEEARAFAQLRDVHTLTVQGISERADKSIAYVTRALALLSLPKKAVKAIESGVLPPEHGHQIARAPEKQRETLTEFATKVGEWTKRVPTFDELTREIARKVEKDLKSAPFPKDVANYGGTETPECNVCPFNTGNQEVLFDGAVEGKCTNPGCFTKRTNFVYGEMRDKVQAQMPKLTFIGFASMPGYMEFREIKGYPIVPHSKMKAVRANPEKYGFSIVKPSAYNTKTGAKVYFVNLDKKAKPEPDQGQQKDWEKERFVEQHVNKALVALVRQSIKKVERKHLLRMIMSENGGNDPREFASWTFDDMVLNILLGWIGDWQVAEKVEALGIKTADVRKKAAAEAAELYAAQKEKTK